MPPRLLRPSFLHLPPPLRTSLVSRSFSATASASSPFLNAILAVPISYLDTLHATGLPWPVILPISAILLRTIILYPLIALPNHRNAQIASQLRPVVQGRAHLHQPKKPIDSRRRGSLALDGYMARFSDLRLMERSFGANAYKAFARSLASFGVLISVTEAVRVKCGSRQGLLPTILNVGEAMLKSVTPNWGVPSDVRQPTPLSPEHALAERLEAARNARLQKLALERQEEGEGDWTAGEDPFAAPANEVSTSEVQPLGGGDLVPLQDPSLFDPSMLLEGLPWCMDITLPDPTGVLPLALGLAFTLSAGVWRRAHVRAASRTPPPPLQQQQEKLQQDSISTATTTASQSPYDTLPARLLALQHPFTNFTPWQSFGLCMSLLVTLAAFQMPAAVLLFFFPWILSGWVQRARMARTTPILPPITACKRPVISKVKRAWQDDYD